LEPVIYQEKSTGDRFQVIREDHALGSVDVQWLSGPEKDKTRTYWRNWVNNRCQKIQEKEHAPVF